jgi:hypothetical protein
MTDQADRQKAVRHAICEATGGTNASYLDTLTLALAAQGNWSQAQQTANRAIEVAQSRGEREMVLKLQRRLSELRQRKQ